MSKNGHLIKEVLPGSIAAELELEAGDVVLTIDGQELEDIFDYEYYVDSQALLMTVRKADGEEWELEIENQYEDLGIVFENSLMSEYRSCKNRCIFCFVDQMPKGMRETLYFKDDDSRLSFLQGNYITLTNLSEKDLERIIRFKLAPINISVHTTNPKLRCQMLHNRFAGEALKKLARLYEAGIPMNGQIVLCGGINDGEELERTIKDLSAFLPVMESLSVVPVGLSKYREGLYPLKPITPQGAREVLHTVEKWQLRLYKAHGSHFVHASDEFYILAGQPFPEEDRYDGYVQLENGVGMVRLFEEEVKAALEKAAGPEEPGEVSIATGTLAAPYIKACAALVTKRFPQRKVTVYPIVNNFFGEQITVAGLITGQDLLKQLKGRELGGRLLLPECMFRSGEDVFLDDLSLGGLQKALQVPADIVKSSGQAFVEALLGHTKNENASYEGYELKEI